MKTALLCSTTDKASVNIKENLLGLYAFKETGKKYDNYPIFKLGDVTLYTTDVLHVNNENVDEKLPEKPDFIIFLSKHKAKSGIPSLTVHTTGNWGKAVSGGKERKLCIAPANMLRFALFTLREFAKELKDFEVIQEVTHHGPYLETPVMFIEIGSDENHWGNEEAGRIIAKTIMHVLAVELIECKPAFGIGGLHHSPNFTRYMEKETVAFGHICPKHMLEFLDEEMVKYALQRFAEKDVGVYVDWKSVGPYKEKIKNIMNNLGIEFVQIK